MHRSTSIHLVLLLLARTVALGADREPGRPDDTGPHTPAELHERVKRGADMSGRTGYLHKRFVGGPFHVIPEAVLEQDVAGLEGRAASRRAFVVLGPDGYSWRFRYDRTGGIPRFRHVIADGPGRDVLEIDAPEAMAFVPMEVFSNQGLICTNQGTCNISGCNCCILCYCGKPGSMCDTDDTGLYSQFERLEERHEVLLR